MFLPKIKTVYRYTRRSLFSSKLNRLWVITNNLPISVVFLGFAANAQVDKIHKHSGEVVEGKVLRLDEYTVVFKYDGEDAENTFGKYAIEKIVYGKTGRVEEVTEKIVINGEADWEKVVILEDLAAEFKLKTQVIKLFI